MKKQHSTEIVKEKGFDLSIISKEIAILKSIIKDGFQKLTKLFEKEDVSKFMNVMQSADYLDITPFNLYKLCKDKKIKSYQPNGKRLYFLKADLDEWLLSGYRPNNKQGGSNE